MSSRVADIRRRSSTLPIDSLTVSSRPAIPDNRDPFMLYSKKLGANRALCHRVARRGAARREENLLEPRRVDLHPLPSNE